MTRSDLSIGSNDRRRPLGALDRLRLRISAWYVATYACILLVLGTGLFVVVARQVGADLDHSLADATAALVRADSMPGIVLAIPAVDLFVTDSLGRALHPDHAGPAVQRAAARAAHEGTATAEVPTGKEHALRLSARAFRARSGELRVAVATADLEDLEDRYLQLITQFTAAAVIALALVAFGGVFLARKFAQPVELTVEHMRQFMSDAAHELRTPVAVLRTESEVALRRPRDGAEDAAAFNRIADDAARLADVVDDLFTLARAESGELVVERRPVFLDDILSDTVSAVGSMALQRGLTLRLGDFEEGPVLGSASLLRRALGIVLDNAIKYTPVGGEITASARAAGRSVVVEVTDTGIGIAAGILPHVFDRFYRGDAARSAAAGAGLGIANARRIAELHGGTLTLESAVGEGTTARLTLPRHEAADHSSAEHASM
jgi:signal transduction histidine kinase